MDQSPGEGDALLLAAGQPAGTLPRMGGQRHLVQQLAGRLRRAEADRTPVRTSGAITFSTAVRLGTRLNAWKTTPTECRR